MTSQAEPRYFRIENVEDGRLLGIQGLDTSDYEGGAAAEALRRVVARNTPVGGKRAAAAAAARAWAAVGEQSGFRVVEMSEQAWMTLAEQVASQPQPEWPTDAGLSPSDAAALE